MVSISMSMPDYDQLIDSETWSFIEHTEAWYPPETIGLSIDRQREIYNSMCREFHRGYPAGITAVDSSVVLSDHSVKIRKYSRATDVANEPGSLVVYFHGGGYVVGGLDSHDDVCSEICHRTGFDVVSVDYRLSPEHLHPAAFIDSVAVVDDLSASQGLPLVLCGDSAGGNLAAAVAHAKLGKTNHIAGQVLIYPSLGGDIKQGSYITHADAPLLTIKDVIFYLGIRGGDISRQDARFSPLLSSTFRGLPPTVVFSAECDPLSDDGVQYCAAIKNEGGNSRCFIEKGMVHGYLRARSSVGRASRSFTRIIESLTMLGNREWFF